MHSWEYYKQCSLTRGEQFSGSCESGSWSTLRSLCLHGALQEGEGSCSPFLEERDQPLIQHFHRCQPSPGARVPGTGKGALWHSGHRWWLLPVTANWAALNQWFRAGISVSWPLSLRVCARAHLISLMGRAAFDSQCLPISALSVRFAFSKGSLW